MPRVLFPNIPMRLVLQPRNKLVQNRLGLGSAAERRDDPRTADPWSKVALHVPPSTSKFEIKQYLSKVYNADVQKARPRLPSHPLPRQLPHSLSPSRTQGRLPRRDATGAGARRAGRAA